MMSQPIFSLFAVLLFLVPRCGYTANRCIDTVLEEGLLHLRCIHQHCTTQGTLQVMLPLLHEHNVRRFTLETGVVVKNNKPLQLTVGGSFRQAFSADGFWGVNGVLDASNKESGTQLSVGLEGYLTSFFTSLSYYLPLDTVQEKGAVPTPHKKQLAKSIEARFFYDFPRLESVRAGVVVEQLMGDAIELPGTDEKQKSPRRGSLQFEYQPMSLVKFHLGYQLQTGGSRCHQVVAGLGLTFRFNQALAEQTRRSIQKKVLLTGDGAYELIARRYDRAIDHGTMPKTVTPVVVAKTPGAGNTTAQGPGVQVTAGKNSQGFNKGGRVTQCNGNARRNVNRVNECSNTSRVQPRVEYSVPRVENIDTQRTVSLQEQLRDAAKGAFIDSSFPTKPPTENNFLRNSSKSSSQLTEEVRELDTAFTDNQEKFLKDEAEKTRREEEERERRLNDLNGDSD